MAGADLGAAESVAVTVLEVNASVLAEHSSYAWNKAVTRVRCNAPGCGTVLEAASTDEAVLVFARHQAQQLPVPAPSAEASEPVATKPPAGPETPEPETAPELVIEPVGEPVVPTIAEEAAGPVADAPPAKATRRNTKALTATIAELRKDDRVLAAFSTPRYGSFTIEGTVLQGGAGQDRNQLIVGGWLINTGERASKHLQELTILAEAGQNPFTFEPVPPLPEHVGIG
ncbi:hypothetical protein ACQCSX_22550 (plasmid) [Pseudarthrobacter sp. P1]|uniref:hypothetical protein n=1 Tax=Pseudarthrobacter sp. P1 TaxID=3418418 RepID=UPI003CFA6351